MFLTLLRSHSVIILPLRVIISCNITGVHSFSVMPHKKSDILFYFFKVDCNSVYD